MSQKKKRQETLYLIIEPPSPAQKHTCVLGSEPHSLSWTLQVLITKWKLERGNMVVCNMADLAPPMLGPVLA